MVLPPEVSPLALSEIMRNIRLPPAARHNKQQGTEPIYTNCSEGSTIGRPEEWISLCDSNACTGPMVDGDTYTQVRAPLPFLYLAGTLSFMHGPAGILRFAKGSWNYRCCARPAGRPGPGWPTTSRPRHTTALLAVDGTANAAAL